MIVRPTTGETGRPSSRPPSRSGSTGLSRAARVVATTVAFGLLAGCAALPPDPIPSSDVKALVRADLARIFQYQEPLSGPLTVHDAMARVLKYNLDNRLKLMEEALSLRQVDVATVSMLPRIAATAGYVSRSNVSASSSQSITTGRQSLETSTSQEQNRDVADLSVTWNILDFGVSYVSAQQQADRALISAERRRKVVQNILQDTRLVFWRAVAADRLQTRIGPLLTRIDAALADSRTIARQRLASPLDALAYQRALLRTRQQLLDLQRELQVAKTQLATLMDLPPASDLTLTVPARNERIAPEVTLSPAEIEETALVRRPELVEEVYQRRIGSDETTKAMLRMLPGIELNTALNFDSNDFLLYNRWADYGARVVWNLFNLITGPANVALAEAQEEFIEARRLALAMAVLTQSRVSWLRYQQAVEDWKVARELEGVEREIFARIRDQVAADQRGSLDAIQAEFDSLLADLGADLAFAETQNAAGNILVTMGFDPLPESLPGDDVATIATALRQREADWFAGRLPAEAASAPPASQTATATPVPAPMPEASPAQAPETPADPVPVAPADPVPVAQANPVSEMPGTAAVRAHLGTFASEALARQSWEDVVKRHAALLPDPQPLLLSSERKSDGKPFVLLRTAGFADAAAADRFCRAVQARRQECTVTGRSG